MLWNGTDEDGVLKLAADFVANYYHMLVSDKYAEALYLYKEDAVLSRGSEGSVAISTKVRRG